MSKVILGVILALLILGVLWLLFGGGSIQNLFGQKVSTQPTSTQPTGTSPSPASSTQPPAQTTNNYQITVPLTSVLPSASPTASPSASAAQ